MKYMCENYYVSQILINMETELSFVCNVSSFYYFNDFLKA